MPCYAENPLLLALNDCRRTVCIHCRPVAWIPEQLEEMSGWDKKVTRWTGSEPPAPQISRYQPPTD